MKFLKCSYSGFGSRDVELIQFYYGSNAAGHYGLQTYQGITTQTRGARRGEGGSFPPPETKKIVVEKWCYFPELYKIT